MTHSPYENEEWRPIPSIPCHEASSEGRIRATTTSVIIAPYEHKSGYIYIVLTPKGGEREAPKQVHRLCLEAFRGPCPDGMESLHVDDNPTNNRIGNLRWATKKENGRDRRRERRLAETRKRKDDRADIDRKAVCLAYSEGATLGALSKAHGVGRDRIKRILMEEGVELRNKKGVAAKFDHDLVVSMYCAGYSQYAIAKAIGSTQATVSWIVRRAGVPTGYKFIDRQRVQALFMTGLRPYQIAAQIDCDPASVGRILEELAASGEIVYQQREARPFPTKNTTHF